MTITPEKLDEIERALQVKLDAEKRLRANLSSKNLAALDAADAQLGVLLDDNAEELVRLARIGERHETRPDPLGDAMNSGDGVYRP